MLTRNLPAPARIKTNVEEEIETAREPEFQIIESRNSSYLFPPIPPDIALCDECRRELLDPANRRYLYPFITCTECGPRYSIVEDTPFDRERTSMVDFPQCGNCRAEYADPADRRFHSQTNSCPDCGPMLRLVTRDGRPVPGDPVTTAVAALAQGRVVALQGIGGFHLAADPRFPAAIGRLRREKSRGEKPFALMVRDLAEARELCALSTEDAEILSSPASPILILPRRDRSAQHLAAVSDLGTLGIMLPYSPLHLLLFFHPTVAAPYRHLVMTSGNLGEEPIIIDPVEALRKLEDSADLFLFHNRRILLATDDSVIRPLSRAAGTYTLVRRSRGFVPGTIRLPIALDGPTLAAGSDLKSAPAVGTEQTILLAPHLGDLSNPESRENYVRTVEQMLRLSGLAPERIVFDLHPAYFSSEWALRSPVPRKIALQHHFAHVLSVMAEYGLDESIGVAFDGTGFGIDGTIWGGEFLHAKRTGFRRLGSFRSFPLPGGEEAIRHPARIAFSLLYSYDGSDALRRLARLPEAEAELLAQMIDRSVNTSLTSSAGRLFDAVAALLGLVDDVTYEGEGPMKLESIATRAYGKSGGDGDPEMLLDLLPLGRREDAPDMFHFDPRPLVAHIAQRVGHDDPEALALLFHRAIADSIVRGAMMVREKTGINTLCISGGVFQNRLLWELVVPALEQGRFSIYRNRNVPPGDGGLALGQAWYAGEGE